jgi:hypothetical protein
MSSDAFYFGDRKTTEKENVEKHAFDFKNCGMELDND